MKGRSGHRSMKANILIVDDEKYNLDAIRRVLRKEENYQLFFAESGDEALDILRNNAHMHMIITDQRMPGMSGIELLQRSLKISPFSIRMILTAFTDSNDMIDAINKGHVYRYIIKPWNPEELKINIKLGLDYYKAVAEKLKLVEELRIKSRLLEKQNVELRKLADMKSRFLVVSSHELRTPATIISGSLELLQINNKNFSDEQNKTLNNAAAGSRRLNKIIETFFEMVKLDSQTTNFNLNDVFFNDLIRAVISRLKNIFDKRKLDVEILSDQELWLRVDQQKIYMVFENLISNAIKFTPDEGKIFISWKYVDEKLARISIQDTGVGIPPDEQHKIFDTFYQLHNVNHHHSSEYEFMGGGPGLGLSICKQIIESHQGKIWVESEGSQKGSTFHITLPLMHKETPKE